VSLTLPIDVHYSVHVDDLLGFIKQDG